MVRERGPLEEGNVRSSGHVVTSMSIFKGVSTIPSVWAVQKDFPRFRLCRY